MSNALEIIKKGAALLPAELQKQFDEQANIQERVTVPTLQPSGTKWVVSLAGKKTVIERIIDGEKVPAAVIMGVVLDFNANRSRAYYEKSFNPDAVTKPDCWSNDGEKPDPSIAVPQHKSCKGCPMAEKNSRMMDNGKGTVACGIQKFLAIQPIVKTKDGWKFVLQPLRLKLAITSIWDGQSPDLQKEGWFAWDNYVNFLRENGYRNTSQIITKLKFDPKVDYPKIIFSPEEIITDPALGKQVLALKAEQKDAIHDLITRTWTPNGVDGERTDTDEEAVDTGDADTSAADDAAAAKAAAEAAELEAKKAAAAKKRADAAAKKKAEEEAAAAAAAKAAEAASAASSADDDGEGEFIIGEDDEGTVIDAKPASKQEVLKDAQKVAEVTSDLSAIVGAWGG